MPVVTTDQATVQAILGNNVPDGTDLTPWINAAITIVTNECVTGAAVLQPYYSDALLGQIASWLAAHLWASSPDGAATADVIRERIETAEVWYDPALSGWGLNQSSFGRTALTLDTNQYLAMKNNTQRKIVPSRMAYLGSS